MAKIVKTQSDIYGCNYIHIRECISNLLLNRFVKENWNFLFLLLRMKVKFSVGKFDEMQKWKYFVINGEFKSMLKIIFNDNSEEASWTFQFKTLDRRV